MKSKTLSVKAAFVSSVMESYRHSHASELCRALSIYEAIDYVLSNSSYTPLSCHILIGSNCSVVIDELRFTLSIVLFARYLSPVLREIRIISKHQNIKTTPIKIKGYQDDFLLVHQLSKLEKMNIWCDLKAKRLIRNATKYFMPFPFELSSPYISNWNKDLILNNRT